MTASITRRAALGTGLAATAVPRRARAQRAPIRIGVLTDMGGPYAANTGPGSVVGAQLAVEDFVAANPGIPVEVVSADLQMKPDVAMAICGKWIDSDGVDVITDVPLSSAAFAIGDLVRQRDKIALYTGAASADITGPNLPTMFGLPQGLQAGNTDGLRAVERFGVKVVSIGFLLPKGTPVVWRGPMIGSAVRQLLHDVPWEDLDYLLIDLPPGTSDASMSMAQDAPIAGVVIVSTPQDVSTEDAMKAVAMFEKLDVPVFGMVENMSYFIAPDTGTRYDIFGHGGAANAAEELGIDFLGEIPIEPAVREGADSGTPIVFGHPESESAQAIVRIAGSVAARLSVLQRMGA